MNRNESFGMKKGIRIGLSFRWKRRLLAAMLMVAPSGAVTVQAATVYVYKDERGAALITDRPRVLPGYTLVKRYGIDDDDRAIDGFSRPLTSAYDDLIARAAREAGIDTALVRAVVHAESAFDAGAQSVKGAVGLMQLMAATAIDHGVSDRTDPWENLRAGAAHLRRLLDRYGDTTLALAAYNAGIAAVTRHGGVPPYPETRTYVRRVLRLHDLYREQG